MAHRPVNLQWAKGCVEGSDRLKQALRWIMMLKLLLTYKRISDIVTYQRRRDMEAHTKSGIVRGAQRMR